MYQLQDDCKVIYLLIPLSNLDYFENDLKQINLSSNEETNQNKNEFKLKELAFDSQTTYEKILGENNLKCSKYMIYFLNVIFYLQENILKNMNFEVCNVFASHGFEIAENKIYDFCSDFLNNLEEVNKQNR